jgi:flagella basal body P-ring formation protein FlgA
MKSNCTLKFVLALLSALLAGGAAAAPHAGDTAAQAEQLLHERVQAQAHALGARVEISLGQALDERASRAPCTPEVFIPPGTRLWGKTYIGLRCPGKPWQVRVPVEVALYAPVPMLLRPMAAGATLQEGDWTVSEINLAAWPRAVVTDETKLAGAQLSRALRAGEPISPDTLQSRLRLGTGDPVQVVLVGQGFTIKASGKVMHPTTPGQSTRVQLDSGRIVAGTMRDDREIQVNL